MTWDKQEREYWDAGNYEPCSLNQKRMASLMLGLVLCDGKVHDIHCPEKIVGTSDLRFKPSMCAACLRISLPVGAKEEFERIARLKLATPPRITV